MASDTSVRQLQRDLAASGCSPGKADGKMGPNTSEAICQYQQAHGLPVTGEADSATLASLHHNRHKKKKHRLKKDKKAAAGATSKAAKKAKKKFKSKKAKSPVQSCSKKPKCPETKGLGSLSAGYESGPLDTKAVGYDSTGGWSWGKYQIETKKGTMKGFLENLKTTSPDLSKKLEDAGGNDGATKDTPEFQKAWNDNASDPALQSAEHSYIEQANYQPNVDGLQSKYGLDVNQRSAALRDVVWSVSVQHGPPKDSSDGPVGVLDKALQGKDASKMSDQQIIDAIYDERSKTKVDKDGNPVLNKDGDPAPAYFSKSTPAVQKSVMERYQKERVCAQQSLAQETAAAAPPASLAPAAPLPTAAGPAPAGPAPTNALP